MRKIRAGSGFLRKSKDLKNCKRSESDHVDWDIPIYMGVLKIDNKDYNFEAYQSTKWGKTDLFIKVDKLIEDNDMNHML